MRAIAAREAKKARAARAAAQPTPPASPPTGWDTRPDPPRRKSPLERAREARQAAAHQDWARRHPDLARAERACRKARAEAMREFGARHDGTPETHAHARRQGQGAIARLWQSGALTSDQLAAAAAIARVLERIAADVSIRTASLETRVDKSAAFDPLFFESLNAVRDEIAYTIWRQDVTVAAPFVLAVIGGDSLTATARTHRIGHRRATALLRDALDRWLALRHATARSVDDDDLQDAHRRIA